jgi:hypothetical protein
MSFSQATGDNPFTGQLTATTSPAALGSITSANGCSQVIIQNDPGSSPNIAVGPAANQYIVLKPGVSIAIPCSNIGQIWVVAASSTATVNWLAVI